MSTSHPTWGGRFKKPLHPQVAQFNASLYFDYILYPYDIQGSQVHVDMLAKQGLISQEEAGCLRRGLQELHTEMDQGLHPLEVDCEDVHMFIEHLLIKKVGEVGKKLHTARSRNDQVALDLRLYTRACIERIKELLKVLEGVLQDLKEKYEAQPLPGYTHLQQAQPITLGLYFGAFGSMLSRDQERFSDCLHRMNWCPLGAGALAGSSLPLDRVFVAGELGFRGIIENTLDAVSDRDFIVEFFGASGLLMMHLSRLCEDLILWASTEFGFIELDDAYATGSSLMPHKKNPDVLELVRGKSGRVFGHLMGLLSTMKGLPMAYNKDMQEDKEALFDTVDTLVRCLGILPLFLENVHFQTEKMHQSVESGFMGATRMVEELVLQGIAFRQAHQIVGQWVAQAMETHQSLQHIAQERKASFFSNKPRE